MDERRSLAALLAEAQAEMPNPRKNREGQKGYQRYSYATLDTVLDIVKPPLNKRGVFVTQPTSRSEDGTMRVQTVVISGDQQMVLDTKPYEYDSDPQEFGRRETYARRYSLLTAFGLAGEDDTDGDTGPKGPDQKPVQEPDAKRRWIARALDLKSKCVAAGVTEEGLDSWYRASFGETEPSGLTKEQITKWGRYLDQTRKDAASRQRS